ncbi:MAG: 2-hydroxyacyl-CoA dehydratase [Chloroflexi bacterium]|nr:2-hydroxyacyl-CoA dehydratase [Chloroflexota bacterium]
MTALETCRELYRQRDLAARDWKHAGGKVVGYLCDNVPEELIIAAGYLPYRLSGAPEAATDALDAYIQPFAPPFSARNRGVGYVDAILSQLLNGDFDFLDYLVIPHTRKTIQAFYRELTLAQSACPDLSLPELYYLDRAYTPFYTSEVFNRQALLDLKAQLEVWCGHPLTPEALADAIDLTNTSRRLLLEVAALRIARPARLSGVDALQVIGGAFFMPKREHNQLLRSLVEAPPEPGEHTGKPRLFVGGSPLDNVELYALVESCGAVVVAEDHCWGGRCVEAVADAEMPPFEALADRYHRTPACSIEFPSTRVVERCLGRARAAGVDGAVFWVMEGDGVHVWDTPDEVAALERNGIPSLVLNRQPYHVEASESLRAQIAEFIGALRP